MTITFDIRPMRLPLAMPVSHASHSRTAGDSLFVRAIDGDLEGLGEGCPRPWVTGEDVDSALAWATTLPPRLDSIASVDALRAFVNDNARELDCHPAAWCGVETALLDLLARRAGVSIETLLGIATPRTSFAFTAVLFDMPTPVFAMIAAKHAALGFRSWKMRVSGDPAIDRERLEILQGAGPESIRIDCNNRWAGDPDGACAHLAPLVADFPIFAIEEPVAPGDHAGLTHLAQALGRPIVLDESACRPSDLDAFPAREDTWIVNIKVSKAGGLLRSLRMAEAARARGWRVVLGAQVGETSLLTRVAMALAQAIGPDELVGQEGAYGHLLLPDEPVEPELRFGRDGVLRPADAGLGTVGLGMKRRENP